uniref:Uncharacterized protein orf292 n=1 Tax=Neglectella solitaria TaxID=120749 RepID=C7BEK0_NEGSO|nr:hypothetical protein [Neglectella solitaria]
MADRYGDWTVQYPVDAVLEIKGVYQVPSDKKMESFLVGYSNPKRPKKGFSATKRKCEITLYYKVKKWLNQVNVVDLGYCLKYVILTSGFLNLQAPNIYWTEFRIRNISSTSSKNELIIIPLKNCVGVAKGVAKPNRAFVFEIFEKNAKTSRKVSLRGVSEDFSLYGAQTNSSEVTELVENAEAIFIKEQELFFYKLPIADDKTVKASVKDEDTESTGQNPVGCEIPRNPDVSKLNPLGICLVPGRIINKKKAIGISALARPMSCFGRGIVDLPENVRRNQYIQTSRTFTGRS